MSILHVVSQHVQLKRSGDEYVGKCPFHKDDTPSFSVNAEKGLYNCFGCGAKGDIYTFIQAVEGIDFKLAKQRVAEMAGVNLADFSGPSGPPSNGSDPRPLNDRPTPTAYYGYCDEKGRRLYEIVRKEWLEGGVRKKTFSQRYQGADGEWIWKKHPRQVLYRLDRVAPADEVWLVEGEKDVHSLEKLGLVATTMAGGAKARWQKTFTDALAGKKVWIVPDNDPPGEAHAQKAYDAIEAVANAVVVRVPGAEKSDVSDWIKAGGTLEQLLALAKAAEENAEKHKAAKDAIGSRREPNEIAKEIMGKHSFLSDMNGYLYEYSGRHWEKITTRRLRQYGQRFDAELHTNQRRRSEIADYIDTACQVQRIEWRRLKLTEVPVLNGVYDVTTHELRPHRKEDYLETTIPVAWRADAACPMWTDALMKYFGDDRDCLAKISALQQFFGYCLLPHARFKKALVLLGEGDTGKSQVAKLLGELVGADNRCAVSVEDMDDPRKRVPIVGKMLNMLTELSSKSVVADSGFKTLISTEEPLLFDPKHLPPFMYSPSCKHLIACNSLPSINDLTKATFNRMLVVRFNRVIPAGEQDRNFGEKLLAELPGVLNWAIAGAADLVEHQGEFLTIPESAQLVEEYRRTENEINAFLDEKAERDPDAYVTAAEVREKFRSWAGRNYSDKAIGAMMRGAGYPSVIPGHGDARRHVGLRWKLLSM